MSDTMYVKVDGEIVAEHSRPEGYTWLQLMSRIQEDFTFSDRLEIGLVKEDVYAKYMSICKKREEPSEFLHCADKRPQGFTNPTEPGDMGSNWEDQVEARHIARMKDR